MTPSTQQIVEQYYDAWRSRDASRFPFAQELSFDGPILSLASPGSPGRSWHGWRSGISPSIERGAMDSQPTFSGFPQAGLAFLADLAAHNERVWFEAHKEAYQTLLLEPAQAFVLALGTKLQALAPDIICDMRTNGQGVLMRLHRDTRFSADKIPYKTTVSGMFWEGGQKKTASPAFGFQLRSTGMDLMAGVFTFSPEMLAAYRSAVLDPEQGAELEHAVETVRRAGQYKLEGEHYKRVPAGYDPNHKLSKIPLGCTYSTEG